MRWDRLFADLEGRAADLELEERDALVRELRDGDWADTDWRDLLGGQVALEVVGLGRVEGEVRLVTEQVVHLVAAQVEHVVSATDVLAVLSAERRAATASVVTSRLGWGHVFRAARDDGDRPRLTRRDGSTVDGEVDVVGRDFVRLRGASGRTTTVPFAGLVAATFSGGR